MGSAAGGEGDQQHLQALASSRKPQTLQGTIDQSRMVNCTQILKVLYVEEERLLGEFKKVCGQILNGTLQIPLLSAGQGCPHHGLHGRWVLWGDEGHLRLPRWEVDGGEEQAAALLLCQPRSGDCSQQGHHDNQVVGIPNIPTEHCFRFEDKDYADLDLEQVRVIRCSKSTSK